MERDTVQEIKERLSIVDVVAPHVKLVRAGKSMMGLCPFHKEKTPSFHVSVERGTYHCFGCGEGGDVFSFVEKIDGLDFRGALKMLAEKAGVSLDLARGKAHEEASSKKERLREVMQRAARWYEGNFPESVAKAYAKSRGLADDTRTIWSLGFAPDAWRALLEALIAEHFTIEELLSAGLIKEADGKPGTYYDRFRNRLMFPIRDAAGRVVAFTGRTLEAGDQKDGVQTAKYLNSPETNLYHKSEILYGMDRAKDAIRTRGFTLLVEGQIDVLHAHQAGFENAVALSGTALSEKHLALMKRYSENLMLVLDADTAGLSATAKSAQLALREGLRVKAVRLPAGKDPADLISEDSKDFAARVKSAKPIVEFFLSVLAEKEPDPHRLLRTAETVVLPLIAAIKSPMEREHFAQVTARTLGLSTETLKETLARLPKQFALQGSTLAQNSQGRAFAPARSARETRAAQLLGALRAYPDTPLASRIEKEYARITGVQAPPPETLITSVAESAAFEAEQALGESPLESAADELLHAFESAVIREAYQEAVANLRRAEAAGDAVAIGLAQEACAKLSARLARLEK